MYYNSAMSFLTKFKFPDKLVVNKYGMCSAGQTYKFDIGSMK